MQRHKLIVLFLACAAQLSAAGLFVSWAPNHEDDLAGYIVLWGTESGHYNNFDCGLVTSVYLDSLADSTTYYVALKAYDKSGNISAPSPEQSFTTTYDKKLRYDFYPDRKPSGADVLQYRLYWNANKDSVLKTLHGHMIYWLDVNKDGKPSGADLLDLRLFIDNR